MWWLWLLTVQYSTLYLVPQEHSFYIHCICISEHYIHFKFNGTNSLWYKISFGKNVDISHTWAHACAHLRMYTQKHTEPHYLVRTRHHCISNQMLIIISSALFKAQARCEHVKLQAYIACVLHTAASSGENHPMQLLFLRMEEKPATEIHDIVTGCTSIWCAGMVVHVGRVLGSSPTWHMLHAVKTWADA